MGVFNQLKETALPLLVQYGLNIVWAIIILIIGWAASKWFAQRVANYVRKSKRISSTIGPLLVKSTRFLVLTITLLIVLNRFGIETASLIALLGTIGLAIGLALQGSLSNVASGLMILILRPFEVGDIVNVNGRDAIIDEIGLFVTEMHTFDNIALIITNTQVWNDIIENHTRNSTRRVDMVFGIHYEDNIDRAMEIIREILDSDERVLTEPEPLIAVGQLADSSVNLYVRPWARTDDHFQLELGLQKKIKERFDEEGITIPYPQQDIHYFSAPPDAERGDGKPETGEQGSGR